MSDESRITIADQFRRCFSNTPVNTIFTRQEILEKIGTQFGTNPNRIIPSDFCYNMTNKGKNEMNPNFFISVETGKYKYVGENYSFTEIEEVIAAYKADFERVNSNEIYKWKAVKWYKEHWNIDAPDFAVMLTKAFEKTENLLTAGLYYPYKMICLFAQKHPDKVRAIFKKLYDESLPLSTRYVEFRNVCNELLIAYREESNEYSKANNHYQDLHAVSVYLSFEYPEIYFIYKFEIYKKFRNLIGFSEEKGKNKSTVWKLENYNRMCRLVLNHINADTELIDIHRARLGDDCDKDEALHMLAMDIIFFGKDYELKNKQSKKEALKAMDLSETNTTYEEKNKTDAAKNTILYGPPGTGKTYNTIIYAVAIIENKSLLSVANEPYSEIMARYNKYKADGLIEFTTFHQSYGYEDFIEGIKPVMESDNEEQSEIEYDITPGIFKTFCEKASSPVLKKTKLDDIKLNSSPTIWKVSLEGTGDNKTRTECLENNHIRVGYDSYGENITDETEFSNGGKNVLNAFIYKMKIGDIVLSCYSATMIDAVGVITGEYEWNNDYDQYRRVRNVKWLVKGIREDISEENGTNMTLSTVYRLKISLADVMEIVNKYSSEKDEIQENQNNYVFIIDEINRGNISKIFGELITLIEPSKRIGQEEATAAKLPYSKKSFGVPENVYLIGTMNTADRSIATIDTALRRRFQFREMQPNPKILEGISVGEISIKNMLTRMNKKISVLYDREHTIGHAYFTPLLKNPSIDTLASIFKNSIIPLLQEYFYDDYEKIRLVLGDNNKTEEAEQFIIEKATDYADLFGETDLELDETITYEINSSAFENIEAYRYI